MSLLTHLTYTSSFFYRSLALLALPVEALLSNHSNSYCSCYELSVCCQDEDNDGYNTSDEEFERQLEEAAMIEEQEKVEKAKKPKMKKGKGKNARRKTRRLNANGEADGDGYEVAVCVCALTLT